MCTTTIVGVDPGEACLASIKQSDYDILDATDVAAHPGLASLHPAISNALQHDMTHIR